MIRLTLPLLMSCSLIAGCTSPLRRDFRSETAQELTQHPSTPSDEASLDFGSKSIPSGVVLDDGISEDEAVALALWNNVPFHAVLTDLGFSRGELVQAGLFTNPVFTVLLPVGPKQLEIAATLPIETICLRPWRLTATEIESEQIGDRLLQNGLDLVCSVRVAYAAYVGARNRSGLADEYLHHHSLLLNHVEARTRASEISPQAAGRVRLQYEKAAENAQRLRLEAEVAAHRLCSLMGVCRDHVVLSFVDTVAAPGLSVDVSQLIDQAYGSRPDLRAAELALDAAQRRADLARQEFNRDGGIFDINSSRGFETGLKLDWWLTALPLFHRDDVELAQAEAHAHRTERHLHSVQRQIQFEVQEAASRYEESREQVRLARNQVVSLETDAVERLGPNPQEWSPLAALEHITQYMGARERLVAAEAAERQAWVVLERQVGRRLASETRNQLASAHAAFAIAQ